MFAYKALSKILGKRDVFPNTGSVAHFDFQSQTIHLHEITRSRFTELLAEANPTELRSVLSVMMHEATHWADTIGTLWGRSYIRSLYECYRLLPLIDEPGQEFNFHKFIELHDRERRIMHSRYFRTVNPLAIVGHHRNPWIISFSAGREFDLYGLPDTTRPVLFARFADGTNKDFVARQPIVAGALLEINAMWSEMRTNFEILSSLPHDQRAVEGAMYGRELLGYLYNPQLTLYTAPAYLMAHYAKVKDVADGYMLASAISHLVLNLGEEHFEALSPPSAMDPWAELFSGFKSNHDCGFAFKVISSNVEVWQEGDNVQNWLDKALAKSNLPSSEEILKTASTAMKSGHKDSSKETIDIAEHYILSLGLDVFSLRSSGDTALTIGRALHSKLPIVPMYDSDGVLMTAGTGAFDIAKFSPDDMYSRSASLESQKQKLLTACR